MFIYIHIHASICTIYTENSIQNKNWNVLIHLPRGENKAKTFPNIGSKTLNIVFNQAALRTNSTSDDDDALVTLPFADHLHLLIVGTWREESSAHLLSSDL